MTAILTNPVERGRFLRFSVVGLIGFVVDFGVMNIMVKLFPNDTLIAGRTVTALLRAGTISFICAVISNFLWNRYWTYPDSRSKPIGKQLTQFSFISAIGMIIRAPILAYVEPWIHTLLSRLESLFPPDWHNFLADNITLAIAVVIVLFWNFFANRYITYNDVK